MAVTSYNHIKIPIARRKYLRHVSQAPSRFSHLLDLEQWSSVTILFCLVDRVRPVDRITHAYNDPLVTEVMPR